MFQIIVLSAVRDRENPLSRFLFRIGYCICVLLAVRAGCPLTTAQTNRGNVDWIFVLDTSASIHAAGGTAIIFGRYVPPTNIVASWANDLLRRFEANIAFNVDASSAKWTSLSQRTSLQQLPESCLTGRKWCKSEC